MGLFSKKDRKPETKEIWPHVTSVDQVDAIIEESKEHPVAFFKHSTRCGTSIMVLQDLKRNWTENDLKIYYLDLLKHRDVSNAIAEKTQVVHQSPQLIALSEGEVKYHASHSNIDLREARKSA